MPDIESFELPQIDELERYFNGPVLVFAASSLDMELLPKLHDALSEMPNQERIHVLLYGLGGEINVARRVALLLYEKFRQVNFVVPYYCQSSFTTLALSGQSIFTGAMSCFSPIDTHLELCSSEGSSVDVLASEDVRLFPSMAKEWFGVDTDENAEALLRV